jgi:hypothetical protein
MGLIVSHHKCRGLWTSNFVLASNLQEAAWGCIWLLTGDTDANVLANELSEFLEDIPAPPPHTHARARTHSQIICTTSRMRHLPIPVGMWKQTGLCIQVKGGYCELFLWTQGNILALFEVNRTISTTNLHVFSCLLAVIHSQLKVL